MTIEEYAYMFPYKKIKIPFREKGAKVKWPDNNMFAVRIYIALEYWGRDLSGKTVNIMNLSRLETYNFEVGIWRALDMLDEHRLKVSVFTNGAGAKFYPEVVKEVKRRGHEIVGHGYYEWVLGDRNPANMSLQEEEEDIAESKAILESVSGEYPRGWVNPVTEHTFPLLAKYGYSYHVMLADDDIPYGIEVGNKVIVEIPHRTQSTGDFAFFNSDLGGHGPSHIKAQRSSREAVQFFKDSFDDYYETAKMEGYGTLEFGIHPFCSCLPDRIRALDRMITYMKGFPKVWFSTYGELEQWWRKNYL